MQTLKVPRYIQWIVITGIIFLLIMSLLRLILVFAFPHPSDLSSLVPAFLLGLRFDLRVIGIISLLTFLQGCIKPLHPIRARRGVAVTFFTWSVFLVLLSLSYTIDFAHYAYLSQRLNGSVLNYVDDAKISMKMVWQTYPVLLILAGLIGGFLLMLGIVKLTYNHILSKPITSTRKSSVIWGILFFLMLAVAIFGRVGQYPLRWSDAFGLSDDYKAQVALNPFQSFFSSLNFRHSTYDQKLVREHYPWMAQHLGVDNPNIDSLNYLRVVPANAGVAGKPLNVVLVIAESFSTYKSSMVANPLNTTPFFNQMVQQGVYFSNCFTPAYGTARGVWATLTGTPDVQLYKTASRNPAAVNQHIIMDDFAEHEKFYFLGGSTSWANIRGVLTNNIPNLHLYEEEDYKAAKVDVWGISDKNLFLEANKVLATQQKPFFAIIQTADNHRPYTIPAEDKGKFEIKEYPQDTLQKYGFTSIEEYRAFRYTDYCIQKYMEAASKEVYFNNTLFVFIGDHGIPGDAGNMLPRAYSEHSLTQHHVPLLFYAPSILPPATYDFASSQLDVMATIAGICGIGYTNTTMGKDLLKNTDPARQTAFLMNVDARRIGIIFNGIYYSYNIKGGGEVVASTTDNRPIQLTDSLRSTYRKATEAYYQTARYLLLNNRRK
ncbi:LTA synthase family protein [Aridibaculum aurantiacum]|uniref:LTA synthase family protein n=1 Tax=Aridibaculum aurantiacum TaxID=2810307 RepID=UPI001A961B96|nr:alkaline phosphatase family protein [Aridibaculum aurantiacum]